MTTINHFNIRVYAIIINKQNEVLLSDEYRFGKYMTKFPGGGLKFNEGTIDCLQREALEEFGQPIKITQHFYTTEFFQQAEFYTNHQLISIYYKAQFIENPKFKISTKPFNFEPVEEAQSFRWANINSISTDEITFSIDKKVIEMLKLEC
jgi:8-oxo-dGTP diphosphatase